MQLLRVATAGSVDDGKSTLIGRLLHDAKAILADQLAAVERTSRERGDEAVDLALLTDGLRAEREQGITIDVAYRYFATPARTFVLADTPGHVQYTRNMVTGASTADVALVLTDARKGVVEQSRRHTFLAGLLGVRHVVLCVNKMDLVDFSRDVFDRITAEFAAFAHEVGIPEVTTIPVSALHGDNVVDASARTPWYDGPALLAHLETVDVTADRNLTDVRFPVQYVIRPRTDAHRDYRGYAGQVASGVLRVGDPVTVLPSGGRSAVAAIDALDRPVATAFPPMSVTVRLADDLDVSRGDVLVAGDAAPAVTQDLTATVCWLAEPVLRPGARVLVKHGTRTSKAVVRTVDELVDVTTLQRCPAEHLGLNDIGTVTLRTATPLVTDPYRRNRATGAFLVLDEAAGTTLGAGLIQETP